MLKQEIGDLFYIGLLDAVQREAKITKRPVGWSTV